MAYGGNDPVEPESFGFNSNPPSGQQTPKFGFGSNPVAVAQLSAELNKEKLSQSIQLLHQAIAKCNSASQIYAIKIDVSLKPDEDDDRIADFDRLVKPHEYAVPMQDKNAFYDELENIAELMKQNKELIKE